MIMGGLRLHLRFSVSDNRDLYDQACVSHVDNKTVVTKVNQRYPKLLN